MNIHTYRTFLILLLPLSLLAQEQCTSHLFAPWRESYLNQIPGNAFKDDACPFCRAIKDPSNANDFVLRIFTHNLVMLNAFPYSKGHILIVPLEHKPHLKDISSAARAEMMELATISLEIIAQLYGGTAANVGINIGKMAGAGIPDHLHMHVVPRVLTPSFISVIGHTEVVGFDMARVYAELKAEFDKVELP